MTRYDDDGGPFEAIDSKLTIYALANGMDLVKEPSRRRLTWYEDGRERGVLIEAPEDDVYPIRVGAWKAGAEEPPATEPFTRIAGTQQLLDRLSEVVEEGRSRASEL